jgi:beta-aspartyl-peptidase (threonine type)
MMTPELEAQYKSALKLALDKGYNLLKEGKSAVEAVEEAVKLLENSHLFNAGKGAVFTATESHEMDASIMDGKTLNSGAVSLVTGIKNPISLARDVTEKSENLFLTGDGAMQFAEELNYRLEDASYFYDELRHKQWLEIKDMDSFQLDHSKSKDLKFGTVGAVACDQNGNISAITSTGGMPNKKWRRVGDSPMIGDGNYANNKTYAASCTGSGDIFFKSIYFQY